MKKKKRKRHLWYIPLARHSCLFWSHHFIYSAPYLPVLFVCSPRWVYRAPKIGKWRFKFGPALIGSRSLQNRQRGAMLMQTALAVFVECFSRGGGFYREALVSAFSPSRCLPATYSNWDRDEMKQGPPSDADAALVISSLCVPSVQFQSHPVGVSMIEGDMSAWAPRGKGKEREREKKKKKRVAVNNLSLFSKRSVSARGVVGDRGWDELQCVWGEALLLPSPLSVFFPFLSAFPLSLRASVCVWVGETLPQSYSLPWDATSNRLEKYCQGFTRWVCVWPCVCVCVCVSAWVHTSARVVSIRTDAPCASVFFSSELSSTLKGFFFLCFFVFF